MAVLHLANPSWRGCPCECTSVAKTIQLRLHSRRRGQRVANGYEGDQCLVPDTVLGSSHKPSLGRQEGGCDACSVGLEVGTSQPSIGKDHGVTTMSQANPSHTQSDGRNVGRVQTSKRRVDRVPSTSSSKKNAAAARRDAPCAMRLKLRTLSAPATGTGASESGSPSASTSASPSVGRSGERLRKARHTPAGGGYHHQLGPPMKRRRLTLASSCCRDIRCDGRTV